MPSFTIRKTNDPADVSAFLGLFEPNGESSMHARLVVDEGEWDLWLAHAAGQGSGRELAGGALCREMTDEAGARRGVEDNLIVDREFRRQGLARRLLGVIEAH